MEHFNYFLGLCSMDGPFCAFLELSIFLSNEGGNKWIIDKTVDFMEYARYLQGIYPSHAISETKKVHPELFNPS